MALNVISNFAANVAHRNLTKTDMEMTDSLAKLSAGTRVISAKDDAASMAIGSRLAAEVNALTQARVNSGQAASMLQVEPFCAAILRSSAICSASASVTSVMRKVSSNFTNSVSACSLKSVKKRASGKFS